MASGYTRADFEEVAPLPRSAGAVFSARLRGGGERVVLKEFSCAALSDLRLFANEVRALRRLAHPNVIALEAVLRDAHHVYIRLPLGGGRLAGAVAGGDNVFSP